MTFPTFFDDIEQQGLLFHHANTKALTTLCQADNENLAATTISTSVILDALS
jgi:hypothetical protein